MKRVFNILLVALLLGYMMVALGFSNARISETLCSNIRISLVDSASAGFYTREDIEELVLGPDKNILGYPVKDINIRKIEEDLVKNPYIKKAELYFDLQGVLRIDITQRKPLVRVITRAQHSWYLDEEGYLLPAKGKFAPFLLVANGYFSEGDALRKAARIRDLEDDETYREWEDVLQLSKYIAGDEFLSAQMVQVYYNRSGDFELIPRVGAHQIIFGDVSEYRQKFRKLKILYDQGLKYEGWNKYEKINLKYKNQVICTKR